MTDYENLQEQEQIAKEIILKLSKMSNNMTFNHKQFSKLLADNFRREHRTLQQGMIRVIADFISEVSKFHTDLRNEAAVNWCKEVAKIEAVFPFI